MQSNVGPMYMGTDAYISSVALHVRRLPSISPSLGEQIVFVG